MDIIYNQFPILGSLS